MVKPGDPSVAVGLASELTSRACLAGGGCAARNVAASALLKGVGGAY